MFALAWLQVAKRMFGEGCVCTQCLRWRVVTALDILRGSIRSRKGDDEGVSSFDAVEYHE